MSDIISSSLTSFFSRVKRGFEKVFLNLIEDDAVSSIESNTNITNDYHLNNSNINESRMGLSILYNKNLSNNMSYLSNQNLAYVSKNDKKSEASKISKRTKNTLNSYYKNEKNLRKEGIIQEVKSLNSGSISSLDNFHIGNRNKSQRNENEADEKDDKNLSLLGKKRNSIINNNSNKKNSKIITEEMKLNNNNNPISSISSASFSNLDNRSNMSYLNINNKSTAIATATATTTSMSMSTSKVNTIKSKNYDQLRRDLELKREKNKKYFEDLKENSRKSIIEEIREKQIINEKFKGTIQKEYHINYFLKDLLKVESVNNHSFHSKQSDNSAFGFKSVDEKDKNKKESLFGNDNNKNNFFNITSKNELFIEGFDNEKNEKKLDTTKEKEKETEKNPITEKPKSLFPIPQQPFEPKSSKEEKKEDSKLSLFLNVNKKPDESNDKPKLFSCFDNFSNTNTNFTSSQTPNSILSKDSPFSGIPSLNNKNIEKKEEASTISSILSLENKSIFQNINKEDNKENIHDKVKIEEIEEIKDKPSIFNFLAPNVKIEDNPISFGKNENTEKESDFNKSNLLIIGNKEIVDRMKKTEEKHNELPLINKLETTKNNLFPSNFQENNQNNEKEITKVTMLNEEPKIIHEKKEDNQIIESPNTSHDISNNNPFNSSSYSLIKGLDTSKSLLNNSDNPFSKFTPNNMSNLPNDSNNLKNNNPFYGSGNKKNVNSYENSLSFSNNSNSNNSLCENIPNNKSLFPSLNNKPFENSNLNLNNTSTFNTNNTNSIFNNNVLSNNNQLNNNTPSTFSSLFNNPSSSSSSSLFPSVNANSQSLFPTHTNNPSSSGFNNNQNSLFPNIQPLSSGILSGNQTNTPSFPNQFSNSNSMLPVNNGLGVGLSSGTSFKIGK